MTKVNFVGNDTPDEQPLPPMAEPVEVELKKETSTAEDGGPLTSKTGNPMIKLDFEVVADGEDYNAYRISTWLVNPETSKRTQIVAKQIGQAFGLTNDDMASGVDFTDLVGKTCKVTLKKDVYDGVENRKIKGFVR